ncbi:MAG: response regulator [Tidjanibacter sp.]|nr:response regulator [Tidjanibacter sp.]
MKQSPFLLQTKLSSVVLLLFATLLFGACSNSASNSDDTMSTIRELNSSRMSSDIISNTTINAFCEDDFGYIWIATERGLNKYNGKDFVHYYRSYSDNTSGLLSSRVTCLFSDSQKRMWIGTVAGVNMLGSDDSFVPFELGTDDKSVRSIFEGKGGTIYAVVGYSLCRLNLETNIFEKVLDSTEESMEHSASYIDYVSAGDGNIWAITPSKATLLNGSNLAVVTSRQLRHAPTGSYVDDNGDLWLLSPEGLQILNPTLPSFAPLPANLSKADAALHSTGLRAIYRYSDEELIFLTNDNKVILYNTVLDRVVGTDSRAFPFAVPDFFRITTIFVDSRDNVWFGSREEGFEMFSSFERSFVSNIQLQKLFRGRSVVDLNTDAGGNLWLLARPNYIVFYNTTTRQTQIVDPTPLFGNLPAPHENLIYSLYVDSSDNIWFNVDNRLVKTTHNEGGSLRVLQHYDMGGVVDISITEDHRGGIWAGGSSGDIFFLEEGASEFESIQLFPGVHPRLTSITTLSNGSIVAAYQGCPIKLIEPELRVIRSIGDMSPDMSNVVNTCFYEDREHNLWIGTNGNGYYRYNIATDRMEHKLVTSASYVTSITEDLYGNCWVATLDYVSKYDRTLDSLLTRAVDYTNDGMGGNQFNYGASATLPDGVIAFGATNGLTFFNPLDITAGYPIPSLYIERLEVNNKVVRSFESQDIVEQDIIFLPKVTLRHDQTSIGVGFAALDYTGRLPLRYQYKMEGVDDGWIDTDNRNMAYYSSLPYGENTFRVRLVVGGDVVRESEQTIEIQVKRPLFMSTVAIVFYIIVGFALIMLIYDLFKRSNQTRIEAEVALRNEAQQRHLNKMNMDFFANISHEFRTPLTMIHGAASTLCEPDAESRPDERLPRIIKHNASRLLRLVSQMLEFNKLENDALKLEVKLVDVVAQTRQIIELFAHAREQKRVTLSLHTAEESLLVYLDEDKYEKVLCNLLSNALKFSTTGGEIDVRITIPSREWLDKTFGTVADNRTYVAISVSDTGIGIPAGKTESIFGRYYQALSGQNIGGTGIGLYFSRKLVELHHGEIKAFNRSEVDGHKGALFTFILPINESAYSESEHAHEVEQFVAVDADRYLSEYIVDAPDPADNDESKPTVLVVDDDYEVQYYLKTLLSPHYNVVTRFDAMSGYEAIEQVNPAVVISDVLMLDVDGYQLCRMVKENFMTSHIPFIMLTAKATVSEQVEGLDAGADAYVVKPFDPKYLLALIKSQLSNRDKIRKVVGESTTVAKIDEDLLEAQDRNFLKQLYELMEKELANPELNINNIAREMLISRTKLYYKIKSLTGDTPTDFFRKYKLNRAMELLKAGNNKIAIVAEMVGYNSPSYFTKLFKEQFGALPREYLRERD